VKVTSESSDLSFLLNLVDRFKTSSLEKEKMGQEGRRENKGREDQKVLDPPAWFGNALRNTCRYKGGSYERNQRKVEGEGWKRGREKILCGSGEGGHGRRINLEKRGTEGGRGGKGTIPDRK